MMKNILIVGLLLCLLAGLSTAATDIVIINDPVGRPDGSKTWSNTQGIIGNYSVSLTAHVGAVNGCNKWFTAKACVGGTVCNAGSAGCGVGCVCSCTQQYRPSGWTCTSSNTLVGPCNAASHIVTWTSVSTLCADDAWGGISGYVIWTSEPIYTVSGSTDCAYNVSLYYNNSGSWVYMHIADLADNSYSFNITTDIEYRLVFNDGHTHTFTPTGDETYNYDACSQTNYRFVESCDNLIPDTEGYFCEHVQGAVSCNWFNAPSGLFTISNSSASKIELYTETFIGQTGWIIDPVVSDTTYTVTNPNIAWGLKVIVQDQDTGTPIDGAVVRVNQSCYCTNGVSVRQKMTTGGLVSYNDMSLQDASLWVYASGYKIIDENTTGYNVFLTGNANLSSKTWVVEMALSSSNNTSEWYETAHTTDIYFKDVNGNITSHIVDTDAHVRLYYQNNNSKGESMTLKFQSSSTHTYFIDEQSWSIPHDESGYKEIVTSYFTPWDYSYRAVMYNSSIHGWNITIPLTVRNGTSETEQHYENLSTHLWFLNAADGKIDYRESMDIGVHACSNNTTLMNIDVELYKDGALLCYKNLTASDFINADFPYYYVYEPQYSYVSGSNYSVRMYGFDGTLLETAYVDCMTDTIVRKNRFTIYVKDRAGTPLTQAYIFLEGWGSLPTGSLSYNAYEGLEDGTYQYKASKSGYTPGGWFSINISGKDETVTYTLTSDTSSAALGSEKMTDDDIKAIFYPCMFFLLIIILIGGLMHVSR